MYIYLYLYIYLYAAIYSAGKGKDFPGHAMKAYTGSRGIAPLILNLSIDGGAKSLLLVECCFWHGTTGFNFACRSSVIC